MGPRKIHKINTAKYVFMKEFLNVEWQIIEKERGNIDTFYNASIDVVWESFQRFLKSRGYSTDFCGKILLGKLLRDAGVEKIKRGPRKQQKFFYFPLKPVNGSHAEAIMASHCGGRYFIRAYDENTREVKPEFNTKMVKRICSGNIVGTLQYPDAKQCNNANIPALIRNNNDLSCGAGFVPNYQAPNLWADLIRSKHFPDKKENYHGNIKADESITLVNEHDLELQTLLSQTIAGDYNESPSVDELNQARNMELFPYPTKNPCIKTTFQSQPCNRQVVAKATRTEKSKFFGIYSSDDCTSYQNSHLEVQPKRSRGRPKGSKNKGISMIKIAKESKTEIIKGGVVSNTPLDYSLYCTNTKMDELKVNDGCTISSSPQQKRPRQAQKARRGRRLRSIVMGSNMRNMENKPVSAGSEYGGSNENFDHNDEHLQSDGVFPSIPNWNESANFSSSHANHAAGTQGNGNRSPETIYIVGPDHHDSSGCHPKFYPCQEEEARDSLGGFGENDYPEYTIL